MENDVLMRTSFSEKLTMDMEAGDGREVAVDIFSRVAREKSDHRSKSQVLVLGAR